MFKYRKILNFAQPTKIVCDNTMCDYKVDNTLNEPIGSYSLKEYLNKECPCCGENLLTETDYETFINITNKILFINKWFSWLTVFFPVSKKQDKIMTINTHKKADIKIEDYDSL